MAAGDRRTTKGAPGGVRERILEAAIGILREAGVQRLTQAHVAERAGVRQSHLTYYFPTREDLLAGVTAHAVAGIADGLGTGRGPSRGDGAWIGTLARHIAECEHMRMFIGLVVEADADPAARALLLGGTRLIEAAIADALGGDDAREQARLVLAAAYGLGFYRFVVRPTGRADPTRAYLAWLATAVPPHTTRDDPPRAASRRAPAPRAGRRATTK